MRELREVHKKILIQLMKDGRQSVSELAKNVGATRQTVAKKIEELKESGAINSFVVRLNPEKFGLTTKAYVFVREDPRAEIRKKNEEIIKDFHQVSEFYRLFGRYDAVLEIVVKDGRELTDLIKKIHALEGVRETETFIVHSTVKDNPEEPFMQVLGSSKST
ncbi:MAG: Lrp/AsnC family transcriptional regulator [Candidatus Hodarchaeaceae archaeon]|nr:Lrp/AsnC family transcriptional regulator [Candidatus Hodarchaeaceae archaeon]